MVIRRPLLSSTRFHTTLTVTMRQNATSTPGDSARFTSVELSEKAMTIPMTASTPSAFALRAGAGVGTAVVDMPRDDTLGADMAFDLVIDIENTPGALADVAAAISDAGVNIAAATCLGAGERAELHVLVPHAEAARHSLAISHLAITREREVVVVDVEDRPGVLADLTRRIAKAGVDLDLVYVATRNRVVFGSPDLAALRAVVG